MVHVLRAPGAIKMHEALTQETVKVSIIPLISGKVWFIVINAFLLSLSPHFLHVLFTVSQKIYLFDEVYNNSQFCSVTKTHQLQNIYE